MMSIDAAVITGSSTVDTATECRTRRRSLAGRILVPLAVACAGVVAVLPATHTVGAAIVPTVNLATAGNYSVLGGQMVTNIGPSTLGQSLGVSPGNAVVGFPPGGTSGVINAGDAVAGQAQADLVAAYTDAAARPLDLETTSELGGLTLVGGVFAASVKNPLTLTGTLTLDGQGDPNSVFIFQTDSTLITASGSSVSLINGAQECNVFWQVGSSATLGTGSSFVGNILALTEITVTTGVTVRGRALARNAAVTLDNDVFTTPGCDLSGGAGTTGGTGGTATTTGTPGGTGGTGTGPGGTEVGTGTGGTATGTGGTGGGGAGAGTTTGGPQTPLAATLPETGTNSNTVAGLLMAGAIVTLGIVATRISRRRPTTNG